VLVTFEEVSANRTKIVFSQIFNTAEACSKVKAVAGDKNAANFVRPDVELGKMAAQADEDS
jgi:hypothetical protein